MLDDDSQPEAFWRELLRTSLRTLAPTDVFAFGEYVFGFEAAPHHRELVETTKRAIEEHQNVVILEPRGHAKTTWATTIFLSWWIARHPEIRVGLISNTSRQSNAFSRAIRWTLQANDYFHDIFGNLVGEHKWTDEQWIQRGSRLHGTKDVTLYSTGTGGPIVSKRFDLILCDDILDEENTANPEQREKVETWFWKTLKPALAPGGSIVVIGTRWAEGDLYQKLIEEKKWPSLSRGAITYDAADTARRHPRALWPEVWPIDKLEQERRDMGSAMFACAYLNDISGLMAGNIFRREWWKDRYFRTLPPGRYVYKMGVDLASSEKEEADWTARVVVAESETYDTYVLGVYRDKRETGHRQFVIDGYNAFPDVSRIVIETNQFQSALVKEIIDTTPLPVVGKRADTDKVTRARAVAARYESGKVHHHISLEGSDFEVELLQFPKGHDDMIDALGYAMETGGGGFVFGHLMGGR